MDSFGDPGWIRHPTNIAGLEKIPTKYLCDRAAFLFKLFFRLNRLIKCRRMTPISRHTSYVQVKVKWYSWD
jgi:hypothetical protein